jgi:hypothetical protein
MKSMVEVQQPVTSTLSGALRQSGPICTGCHLPACAQRSQKHQPLGHLFMLPPTAAAVLKASSSVRPTVDLHTIPTSAGQPARQQQNSPAYINKGKFFMDTKRCCWPSEPTTFSALVPSAAAWQQPDALHNNARLMRMARWYAYRYAKLVMPSSTITATTSHFPSRCPKQCSACRHPRQMPQAVACTPNTDRWVDIAGARAEKMPSKHAAAGNMQGVGLQSTPLNQVATNCCTEMALERLQAAQQVATGGR